MTREEYLKHKELMEAWANGAEIEGYFGRTYGWVHIDNPSWAEDFEYRIKPKLTLAYPMVQNNR